MGVATSRAFMERAFYTYYTYYDYTDCDIFKGYFYHYCYTGFPFDRCDVSQKSGYSHVPVSLDAFWWPTAAASIRTWGSCFGNSVRLE